MIPLLNLIHKENGARVDLGTGATREDKMVSVLSMFCRVGRMAGTSLYGWYVLFCTSGITQSKVIGHVYKIIGLKL